MIGLTETPGTGCVVGDNERAPGKKREREVARDLVSVVVGYRGRRHVGPEVAGRVDHHGVVQHHAELLDDRFQPGLDERVEHEQRIAAVGQVAVDGLHFAGEQRCLSARRRSARCSWKASRPPA